VCTKFHEAGTDVAVCVLLLGRIYDVHHLDALMYNILTKFREDWYRHSSNSKVLLQQFEYVGITEGKEL
jgi:hypothetical protein